MNSQTINFTDHENIVRLLIENGIELNTLNKFNNTALIVAIFEGNRSDISKTLLYKKSLFFSKKKSQFSRVRQNCRAAHSKRRRCQHCRRIRPDRFN